MSIKRIKIGAAVLALASSLLMQTASAAPVLCKDIDLNHMYVDSAFVSSCLDAGIGNINGNPLTDDYLIGGGSGTGIGAGSFTQVGDIGTFSLDGSLWGGWSNIAIGFKFGTGRYPDQWFVYQLNQGVTAGLWQFVNTFETGGGLSHIQLYGLDRTTRVPEPATLALFGFGLIGMAFVARRRKARVY